MKTKRREAPAWVFSWKAVRRPPVAGLLAVAIVALGFGVVASSLRIRIGNFAQWSGRSASLLQIPDNDADGRALATRAREGGPFPSRFEPAAWPELAAIEDVLREVERTTLPPYRPVLRELEPAAPGVPALAEPGRAVLPRRPLPESPPAPTAQTRLVPRLRPLAGITRAGIPDQLPAFDAPVSPAMAADSTRLMLHVDASGRVIDCIALDAGAEAGPPALQSWLREVVFPPQADTAAPRWFAVRVVFMNQFADGNLPD